MSTTITPPQEQDIDSKAFIEQRNKEVQAQKEGKPAPVIEKPKEEAKAAPKEGEEPTPLVDEDVRLSRSTRREMNRLLAEAAELRGRLKAYEEFGVKPKAEEIAKPTADDPEPKQADFATEAEYNRAVGRWEARQETKKELGKRDEESDKKAQDAAWTKHLEEMSKKMSEDIKTLPDWADAAKEASELEFISDEHPALVSAIAGSDVQAFIWYHFAKNHKDFEKIFSEPEPLRKDYKTESAYLKAMQPLAAAFKRLEGKVEVLYSKQSEAAQASPSKPKAEDRTVPEKRATAVDRDVHKPRPSTEVAARGGSAPPAEPEIGSKAWMELRNQVTGGR